MRRVERITPVAETRDDHAHRRLVRLHDAGLHRRRVAAQDDAVGQVERVPHVGGRVLERDVEGLEVVPLRLRLRAAHPREAQLPEDLADLIDHPRYRMDSAAPGAPARHRQIDVPGGGRPAPSQSRIALGVNLVQSSLYGVGGLPDRRPLLGRRPADLAQHARQVPVASEEPNAHFFQLIGRSGTFERRNTLALDSLQLRQEIDRLAHDPISSDVPSPAEPARRTLPALARPDRPEPSGSGRPPLPAGRR